MTPKRDFSLGVDLAQRSFQVALAPIDGDPAHWRDLPHTAIAYPPDSAQGIERLAAWVERHGRGGRCRVLVVESTGKLSMRFARASAGALADGVSIVNPRWTKAWAVSLGAREKTDRLDAAMLALYGAARRPRPTPLPRALEAELQELTRLRQGYVEDRTAWLNRRSQAESSSARRMIEQTLEELEAKIQQIERACEALIETDPLLAFQYRALQQIKGVKKVAALTLTAELGDLRQYGRNQLVGRVGVFPRHYTSGSSVWRPPRMAKGGCGRVRRVLYMCATSLFRARGAMRQWIEAMKRRGVDKAQIVGAVMRKLLLIARALMMNNGVYDESKIGIQGEKVVA